jgi:hypothetical protein
MGKSNVFDSLEEAIAKGLWVIAEPEKLLPP